MAGSYTHLDVYKRQIEMQINILQERGVEIRDWENKERVLKQVRTVSYTHLYTTLKLLIVVERIFALILSYTLDVNSLKNVITVSGSSDNAAISLSA